MKASQLAVLSLTIALLAVSVTWLPAPQTAIAVAPSAPAVIFTVTVGSGGTLTFSPATYAIPLNSTVNWVWASGFHSTTSGNCAGTCTPDGKWNSNPNSFPFSFSHSATFTTAGSYPYFCSVHGSAMRGTITVGPTAVELVAATAQSESPYERAAPFAVLSLVCVAGVVAMRWLRANSRQS